MIYKIAEGNGMFKIYLKTKSKQIENFLPNFKM